MNQKAKIYILDDHPIIAEGLRMIIAQTPDMQVIGSAQDAKTAVSEIGKLKPDVVILEVTLKDSSGVDIIKRLRHAHPDVKILVYSLHEENTYAERCLRAGAMGYLMKTEPVPRILQAIRQVTSGGFFFSLTLLNNIVSGGGSRSGSRGDAGKLLSDRQLEVFEMVGKGFDSHEIAEKLELSSKTVDAHKAGVRQKLGLASARELLMEAVRWVEK